MDYGRWNEWDGLWTEGNKNETWTMKCELKKMRWNMNNEIDNITAITSKANLFVVNVLDIQFNLLNVTFKPYRKPNNDKIYVHKDSNYPLQELKELPKTISEQILTILSSKELVESSKVKCKMHWKLVHRRRD